MQDAKITTEDSKTKINFLSRLSSPTLAYRYSPQKEKTKNWPTVMFCGGYRSDMNGTKATYLEKACQKRGQGFVCFDYSGHGQSEGRFEDGTIGIWTEDALNILDQVAQGPIILVGSSMGGWIALLLARARAGKIQGLLGLAAAPDFTKDMYELHLSEEQKRQLEEKGRVEVPNDYSDDPYIFTKKFYEESQRHLVLKQPQTIDFPMRFIQGMKDKDVPWETAVKIQKNYNGVEIDVIFIDDGDHSLSRPEDLVLIDKEVRGLSEIL